MALNRGDLPPVPQAAEPVGLPDGALPPRPLLGAPSYLGPEYGGPSQVTEPPQAPLDTRLIQQMLALRGAPPTPPAPLSRGQRIANALMGFGAGVQGNGPQFVEQLQQPQRRFEAQQQAYNQLGTELGVRGLETAQRQQEQKTRRAQEVSDQQLQAEFQRETRRLRLTDDREKALLEDMLLSRRQREHDERAAEEQRQREKAQRERDAIKLEGELVTKDGAPQGVAREIARRTAGLSDAPLSPAAEKWRSSQAKLADAKALRLARIAAGGGGAAEKDVREIVDANGNVIDRLPINKIPLDQYGAIKGYPPGSVIRPSLQQHAPSMPASPYLNPVGESGMLSETLPGGIRMSTPIRAAKTYKMDDIRAYAAANKISVTKALKIAKDAGFTKE
jgi:hypothetical protein